MPKPGTDRSSLATAPVPVIRLGYIDYLNCLPVYFGIEQGAVDLPVQLVRGTPTEMNRSFLHGELEITPISSIEYARNAERCAILPNLSISADGRVASILLFHKRPLSELGGRPVALTSASATSVVLTKIILQERYGVRPDYRSAPPDLNAMLMEHDAALLIGDDALLAAAAHPELSCVDLGAEWKAMTGHMMVYGLWVVQRAFAEQNPAALRLVTQLFHASQDYSWAHRTEMVAEAMRRRRLPKPVIEDYADLIRHEFGPRYRRGLITFLEHARRIGELERVPDLRVWGEA
jgi:chorismate dehydratase